MFNAQAFFVMEKEKRKRKKKEKKIGQIFNKTETNKRSLKNQEYKI